MHTANMFMERGKCVELLQSGPLIPEPHSAALQVTLALRAAHLGNTTSPEHALGMWSFWET